MAKRNADPIQAANAAWRKAMDDPDYAAWYRSRLRMLIAVCEFESRKAELVALLDRIEIRKESHES